MTLADAPAVAGVNITSWRESYAHVVAPEVLAGMDAERSAAGFAAMLDGSSASPPTAAVDLWPIYASYARNGFVPDGAWRVHEPWGPARIVRLVR